MYRLVLSCGWRDGRRTPLDLSIGSNAIEYVVVFVIIGVYTPVWFDLQRFTNEGMGREGGNEGCGNWVSGMNRDCMYIGDTDGG